METKTKSQMTMNSILQIRVLGGMIIALGLLAMPATASVPQLISYHGILKDSGGNFLTGDYSMTFRIYEEAAGGAAIWTETQANVSLSSGRFNVVLGSVTPLGLDFSTDYWLSVQVAYDEEMTPRQKLTSVGYAFMAENVVNGFTESQHNALSHKNILGVKTNMTNIAKTNFKVDAYTRAAANSMSSLIVDSFNDAGGIDPARSSGYLWRGNPDYDVIQSLGGNDAYTVLLIHANGSDGSKVFTDASGSAHPVIASGDIQVDTAQSKWGGASALADGNGDYLSIPDHENFTFGTGDWSVDFWIRFASTSANQVPVDIGDGDNSGIRVRYLSSDILRIYLNGNVYNFPWDPATNIWYHVEISRAGTSLRAFVDGVQIGNTESSSENISPAAEVRIGRTNDGTNSLNGWIDEIRLSKGIARHVSNFALPDSEYVQSSGSATVVSTPWAQTNPSEALLIVDQALNTGSITYFVSRDNGTTWTEVTADAVTSLTSQPPGSQVRWKAEISGDAQLDAIAVSL